jgi:hypothetical protein
MASAYLEHPVTKQIKEAKLDNWNILWLLLGPIAPLVRGDIKYTLLLLIPGVNFFVWIVGVNKYNFWYIQGLLKNGYKIKTLPPTMTPEMLSAKTGLNVKNLMLS